MPGAQVLHLLGVEGAVVQLPLLLVLLLGEPLRVRARRIVHQRVLQQGAEHESDTNLGINTNISRSH